MFTPLSDAAGDPPIRGFLHEPAEPNGDAIVLTHGAGANCQSKLLTAMAEAFAATGFTVLRFDLPFRVARPFGPPRPGSAEKDREGLRRAVALMREKLTEKRPGKKQTGRIFLGGHSYGGRQATILISELAETDAAASVTAAAGSASATQPANAKLVDSLLLLSYPLHPPKKPEQLRTAHLPKLNAPSFFVHGANDPFGTLGEMKSALKLIPAPTQLLEIAGAGHDLIGKKSGSELAARAVSEFQKFVREFGG